MKIFRLSPSAECTRLREIHVNAALGVSAEYQSMTFGLNYRYGFGSNDRSNNALHATFRYAF